MRTVRVGVVGLVGPMMLAACGPQAGPEAAPGGRGTQGESSDDLECVDADYVLEPTFATPEAALKPVLEREVGELALPDSIGVYECVVRSEESVEFEFRQSEERHHTWEAIRSGDGRWVVASFSGCFPAGTAAQRR